MHAAQGRVAQAGQRYGLRDRPRAHARPELVRRPAAHHGRRQIHVHVEHRPEQLGPDHGHRRLGGHRLLRRQGPDSRDGQVLPPVRRLLRPVLDLPPAEALLQHDPGQGRQQEVDADERGHRQPADIRPVQVPDRSAHGHHPCQERQVQGRRVPAGRLPRFDQVELLQDRRRHEVGLPGRRPRRRLEHGPGRLRLDQGRRPGDRQGDDRPGVGVRAPRPDAGHASYANRPRFGPIVADRPQRPQGDRRGDRQKGPVPDPVPR